MLACTTALLAMPTNVVDMQGFLQAGTVHTQPQSSKQGNSFQFCSALTMCLTGAHCCLIGAGVLSGYSAAAGGTIPLSSITTVLQQRTPTLPLSNPTEQQLHGYDSQ
jgi:hypothetical protein